MFPPLLGGMGATYKRQYGCHPTLSRDSPGWTASNDMSYGFGVWAAVAVECVGRARGFASLPGQYDITREGGVPFL